MSTAIITIGAIVPQANILGSSYSCAKNGIDPPGVNLPFSIVNPNPNFTYNWSSIQTPTGWNITPPMTISTTNQINPLIGVNTFISFPISGFQGGINDNYLIQVISTAPNGCTSTTIYPVHFCCHALPPSGAYEWENESASNVTPLVSGDVAIIRGVFQVDINTTWTGVTIEMDAGAQIVVNPGAELFINGSTITYCETFWKSILVDNGLVTVFNSIIEGGQYAIDVINGGGYVIQKGNVLRDNFVSLRVTGAGGTYPRMINNTTITSTSIYDVLGDHNGQSPPTCFGVGDAPHRGILLSEAGQNTIGVAAQNLPLIINNVFIGIESISTDVTIMNTKISQLLARPCIPLPQWSRAGIYSHGNVRSTIVNTPSPNHCTFDNCRTGIFGVDVELIAGNTDMNNVTFGIQHQNPPSILINRQSLIYNNTIRSFFEGIRITSTTGRNHHTDVRGNRIIALAGAVNGAGIRWEDFIIAGKQNDISGNFINLSNNYRWGIRFLNHNDYTCTLNNITLNSPLIINGINAVANRNFTINDNTVTDLFTSTFSRGINVQTSSSTNAGNRVFCNIVGNCRMDFLFDQSNLNVDWASNTMNGGRTGLQLQNGAALIRTQPWNWWCGNFTTWWINSIGGSYANWIQDNVSNGGCITSPSGMQLGGSGISFAQLPSNDPGCPRPIVNDPFVITEQDRWIATDSNWETMNENMLWQYRRSLSDKLLMHPTLITSDSIVNNFWQAYQSLDEIQLAGLMKNTVLIDSLNASNYGTLAKYTDSIISIRNLLIYNDSLLTTDLSDEDSVRILEDNIIYSSQIASWGIISDSLNNTFNEHLKIYRDSVFQLYDSYSPQTERGNIEKSIWKLILTYGMGSQEEVPFEDSLQMSEYAHLCMLDYGASIAAMRSFYESYTGLILDDEDVCVSGERIRNNTLSSKEDKADFTLIPNPTQGNVHIITQNLKDGEFTIRFFNAQGLLLLNQTSHTANKTIELEGFSPGVYYVNLSWNEGVATKKLIILQ
jgi:hypothetical protein